MGGLEWLSDSLSGLSDDEAQDHLHLPRTTPVQQSRTIKSYIRKHSNKHFLSNPWCFEQKYLPLQLIMSDKEFSEKLKAGIELAGKRMLEEKALRGEDLIVSPDGKTIERIPAKQLL